MKRTIALILVCGLLAPVAMRGTESNPNAVCWVAASNSIPEARWPFKWKSPFAIATNTPAFEAYGLEFMLTGANDMREKWRLDIPQPLTDNGVYFAVCPSAHGIEGHLMTKDRRFKWTFARHALCSFQDLLYQSPSFRYHDDESARLAKIKSKITAKEAETIARNALYKLFGRTEKQLGMKKAVEVNQYKFEESDGTVYSLPLFDVRWRMAGSKQYSADNLEYTPLNMEISGITKNVAAYEHAEYMGLDSPLPRPPMPTNYFQMLGLPTNYLETLAETKRLVWGLPPLTNSPSQRTNSGK